MEGEFEIHAVCPQFRAKNIPSSPQCFLVTPILHEDARHTSSCRNLVQDPDKDNYTITMTAFEKNGNGLPPRHLG